MAPLPIKQAITRFKNNDDRIDIFANGSDTQDYTTSGGTTVPSIRKFLALKNTQINDGADSILQEAIDARDLAEQWASNPVNSVVAGGKYSAFHWATQANSVYDLTNTVYGNTQTVKGQVDTLKAQVETLRNEALGFRDEAEDFAQAAEEAGGTPDDGTVSKIKLTPTFRKYFEHKVTPFEFGAVGDGVANDGPAIQLAINALKAMNGGLLDLSGNFKIVDGVAFDATKRIRVVSDWGKIYYPQTSAGYYHLFRVTNSEDWSIENVNIYSDASLVRGDTGFAIQVAGSYGINMSECRFKDIASACFWADTSQDIRTNKNIIDSGKADGIHFSDGCLEFTCSDNTINNVEDDAIAVVRDIGGGIPRNGTIHGNVVRHILRGHGTVLISCDNIVVSGNEYSDFIGAAIASYTWTGTTTKANNLLITGNKISLTGKAPENAQSATSLLFSNTTNSRVIGNDISGPEVTSAAYPKASIIFQDNSTLMTYKDNVFHDSVKYGIYVNDASGTVNSFEAIENKFKNIVDSAIKSTPTTQSGKITIADNKFEECGYNNPDYRVIDIANVGANRLYIGGNKQIDTTKKLYFDPATCTNVMAEDNTPPMVRNYNCNLRGDTGALTAATATAFYWISGGLVYLKIIVQITTKGTPSTILVDVPYDTTQQGGLFKFRETSSTGISGFAEFNSTKSLFIAPADAAAANPVANGRTIEINGYYTPILP